MFSSLLPKPKHCTHSTIKVVFPEEPRTSSALVVPTNETLTYSTPGTATTGNTNLNETSITSLTEIAQNDNVAEYGKEGVVVQMSYEDTIPLKQKYPRLKHFFPRYTLKTCPDDSLQTCLNETRRVIEEILLKKEGGEASTSPTIVSYTPNTIVDSAARGRTLEIREYKEDPMMPPKFKLRKNREKEPSPPPPVLKAKSGEKISKEVKDQWHIPSAVSNWKNNQGFAISLDKRVNAASGGSVDNGPSLNIEKFGALSSALESADKQARNELAIRNEQRKQMIVREQAEKDQKLKDLLAKSRQQYSGKRGPERHEYERDSKRYRGE